MDHIGALKPDPRNARRHTPRNVGMIANAMHDVGAARSIVIDEDNIILAGNATIEAAAQAGIERLRIIEADGEEIIAVRRSNLTPEQKTRLALFDNRAAELAEWDESVIASLAEEVDLTGLFNDDELAKILANLEPATGLTDPDDVPESPAEPITKPGDLWQLGRHRLLCGDSTVVTDVARLMAGERADMLFTDPPYGVDYDGGTKIRDKLSGDNRGTDIYGDVLPLIAAFSDLKSPLYLWHADRASMPVLKALTDSGYEVRAQIIWNKNQAQYGALTAQYKQKHEPCFYAFRKGEAPYWYGPTNEITVWDIDRAPSNDYHPTQKPVALAERAIGNSSTPNGLILDLFGGSGSTLIACEQTGRRCAMMEIDPRYCDVIITRWQNFTGHTAALTDNRTE